ncbi:MAG: patatin-like phospholipase family protein [Gammaproteobacteria bacterium]
MILGQRPAVAVWVACLCCAATGAQAALVSRGDADRPRVGLVLAGGGAKGGAHIGVLKVLEELHVPVDCVAGTSVGALVGGGYAAGLTPSDMEEFVLGIDWRAVVGGAGERDLEPIEQKQQGVIYSNRIEAGIRDWRLRLESGLVDTNDIENLLREYVAAARRQPDFDRLPIPFRAVATDMVSGEMVVLKEGDLATALRASMAIPGAFSPVISGDRILADGGMVRNIPVDVARQLCADVVIVVNLVEDPPRPEDLQSAAQLLSRSTDVMFSVNEKVQLDTLAADDVRIDVPVGDIGTAEFDRIAEAVPMGAAAARRASHQLAALAVEPADYAAWRARVTSEQDVEVRVAEIVYEGLERVNEDYLRHYATIRPGDVVDTEVLSREARAMSALRDIESVGYRLEGEPAATRLVWMPREKSIGPDYVRFDLGGYSTVSGDWGFALYAEHRRTWMNDRGAEWRSDLLLGRDAGASTSVYLPFDVAQRYFFQPRLFAGMSDEAIYRGDERVARYRFSDLGGGLELGVNLSRYLQARIGYRFARRNVDVDTGPEVFPEVEADDAGPVFRAVYDSRDTRFSPTEGLAVALEYVASDGALGGDRDWERAELGVGLNVPLFARDVLWVTGAAGSALGSELPFDRAFAFGGPSSFPGLELGQIRGDGYWTVGTSYLWRIRELISLRGDALYLGTRLQAGGISNRIDGAADKDIYGASVFLAGRTLAGPLSVGVGRASTDSWSLWLAVGRPVTRGIILDRGIFR